MLSPSLEQLLDALRTDGLRAALRVLNSRTPHRFTGIYHYDQEVLRNVALFDRWDPLVQRGADAPMMETFCAIVPSQGIGLEVRDGPNDDRFPWMQSNPVVCYCGALIRDDSGAPWGTLCHFDVRRCDVASSYLEDLIEAGPYLYGAADRMHRTGLTGSTP